MRLGAVRHHMCMILKSGHDRSASVRSVQRRAVYPGAGEMRWKSVNANVYTRRARVAFPCTIPTVPTPARSTRARQIILFHVNADMPIAARRRSPRWRKAEHGRLEWPLKTIPAGTSAADAALPVWTLFAAANVSALRRTSRNSTSLASVVTEHARRAMSGEIRIL